MGPGPQPHGPLRSLGFCICDGGCCETQRTGDERTGPGPAGSGRRPRTSRHCCQRRYLLAARRAPHPAIPALATRGRQPPPGPSRSLPLGVPSGVCKKGERGQGCQRLPPADRVPPMGGGAWGGPPSAGTPSWVPPPLGLIPAPTACDSLRSLPCSEASVAPWCPQKPSRWPRACVS